MKFTITILALSLTSYAFAGSLKGLKVLEGKWEIQNCNTSDSDNKELDIVVNIKAKTVKVDSIYINSVFRLDGTSGVDRRVETSTYGNINGSSQSEVGFVGSYFQPYYNYWKTSFKNGKLIYNDSGSKTVQFQIVNENEIIKRMPISNRYCTFTRKIDSL